MSRVLIIGDDVFSKGGISRYTRYQLMALKESEGIKEVFLFSLYPEKPDNKFEEDIDVAYIGTGRSMLSKLRYMWNVLRFIQKKKITLVISTHLQLSIIAYIAKLLFGTRYSTNVYGLEVWGDLKSRDKIGLLKSDHIIGDCNFILNYVKNNFEYSGNTLLLHDPVDINRFKPFAASSELASRYGIPRDGIVVMTVGRLERNKGHKVMIEALSRLPADVHYVVVGGGFMDKELRALAHSCGVKERVTFTGRVPEEELVAIYNLADIILLLSTFGHGEGEGLPLGLIEGSACGKPIVCGNQDGSAEAYNPIDPNGYLISPVDVSAVVNAISDYHSQPELLEKHGMAGRHYVEQNFNYTGFRDNLLGFIKTHFDK